MLCTSSLIRRISPDDITFDQFDYDWLMKVEDDFDQRGIRGFNWMNQLKILFGKAVQAKIADFSINFCRCSLRLNNILSYPCTYKIAFFKNSLQFSLLIIFMN